jgi:asparagine synthase (glutamine-hydrolysing)
MVQGDGPVGLAHALLRTCEFERRETGIARLAGRDWIAADARLAARVPDLGRAALRRSARIRNARGARLARVSRRRAGRLAGLAVRLHSDSDSAACVAGSGFVSGFTAIVNRNGAPVDRQLIRETARRMAFRGPDGLMVHGDGPVGLAHALLRTGEFERPETGIASLAGRYWIAADARLDAREELGESLGLDVWRLRATSDAELILQLYAARGEDGLDALVGDFAFALWDAQRQQLVCARDAFGVKPCFYASVGDAVIVSNTLPCLLAHPDVADDVDESVVADFLITRENPALDKTFFRNVRRLPPAHRLKASKDSVRVERYWTLPDGDDVRYRRSREYVEHFTELLRRAVSDRLPERGAAVSMSGGMDSSSVAAMCKEVLAERCVPKRGLFACTAVYERSIPDEEGYYAALVGEALGIPVHYFPLDDYELFGTLDRGSATAVEPVIDPLESDGVLFDFAARRTRVMLTGHGGDPAFRFDPFYLLGLLRRGRALRVASESLRHLFSFGRPPSVGPSGAAGSARPIPLPATPSG